MEQVFLSANTELATKRQKDMNRNATIRKWFESAPEKPSVFSIPETNKDIYGLENWANLPHGTWNFSDVPDSVLDQEFYSGYGCQQVPRFHAWSENYVYYVHEYDGSTMLSWVPRNPPEQNH